MKFTHFLTASILALSAITAHALEIKPYTAATLESAQKANLPVALHFYADWCPVCRAQEKILNNLKSDKSLNLTVLVVNYDTEKKLKQKLNVRTQSTLIVYKGSTEKARLAGDTNPDNIKAALRSAL